MNKVTDTHHEYKLNQGRWELYLRSYMGGQDYKDGNLLTRYINEDADEYNRRIALTPIDNHCKNIVHIYSSYISRVSPARVFNSLGNNPALVPFLRDADLDGQTFDSFIREAGIWASVYGHVWITVDKPVSNAGTRADELAQGVRPYLNLFTPENVLDWKFERGESGRYRVTYLKLRESIEYTDAINKRTVIREWTEDEVRVYEVVKDKETLIETMPNPIGMIPAVYLPANRSIVRGVGISDLADIAYMQQAIYQELSEIEQLIRISNHPTLVKTYGTDASAGAGAVINIPDEIDPNLKPYQIQPNGGNLDAIRASIKDKIESINKMAHMGAVRGTETADKSGVAMTAEFQLLNARLAEKADILELAEEQLWRLVCVWLDVTPDVEIIYPDTFDIRDYSRELQFLQQAKASGVKSAAFVKAIDKQIADLVLDDEELQTAYQEIDSATQVIGQF